MRLCFPWSSIEVRSWDSRSKMEDHLSQCETSLIIGESAEQEREFYSATFQPEFRQAKARRLAVGVCSEGHGILPQLLLLPNHGLLLFGVNNEVVAVRVETGSVAYRVPLGFLFRSMVPLANQEIVLAFHEIGVAAFREDGQICWTFDRDVVEDAWLDKSGLHIAFMDTETIVLDLASGKELGTA